MTNAWDQSKKLVDKHSSGIFVRLKNDGDVVVGAICGDPYVEEVHNTGEEFVECAGETCEHCAAGNRAFVTAKFNLFVPSDGSMKVLEGPAKLFKAILAVRDKYGLDKECFEIRREGKAKDPKTTYRALPDVKIDAAMRERISKARLHDLARVGKETSDEAEAPPAGTSTKPAAAQGAQPAATPTPTPPASPPSSAPEALIALAVANEFIGRLKNMPRASIDAFLRHFAVQRVRDVQAAKEAEARALLDSIERQNDGGGDEFAV